jgi:hypothetical protein
MDKSKLAVCCAMHCDPYQAIYYKKLFDKYWGNEVGGLYIKVSGLNYLGSKDFILDLFKDTADFIDADWFINDHGMTLDALYPEVPDDKEVVMIMDSDEWIYKPGLLTDFLNSFDEGIDIVGEWCDSGSVGLKDKAHEIFGRCRLNPMIVLIRKKLLDQIPDIHFGSKNWKAGEVIVPLKNWVSLNDECTDTFGYVGLQLLNLTDNLRHIKIDQDGLFHAASLSSWMITYSQREPIYEPDQHFLDRLAWWYWLATRFRDEYPDKVATDKHIKKLLKFGEANKISKELLEKHQEMLFKRIPQLKL